MLAGSNLGLGFRERLFKHRRSSTDNHQAKPGQIRQVFRVNGSLQSIGKPPSNIDRHNHIEAVRVPGGNVEISPGAFDSRNFSYSERGHLRNLTVSPRRALSPRKGMNPTNSSRAYPPQSLGETRT